MHGITDNISFDYTVYSNTMIVLYNDSITVTVTI